ncbi:MAG TPA: rhomboid family intramembrane serine protease [Chthoniobacterales bacterium]
MLDLNDILLFIALVSPLVLLARTWSRRELNRNWQFAAISVLIVTGAAWTIAPRAAGFIGGGAWLLLLFVPSWSLRSAGTLAAQQRFASAAKIVSALAVVQPTRMLRDQARLLRALALAQRGERESALSLLNEVAHGRTSVSRRAAAQAFRVAGNWEGLLAWCEHNVPRAGIGDDPSLLPLYFRALGELGMRDMLVLQFAGRAPMLLASPQHQQVFVACLTVLFAFCGRTTALVRLFETKRLRLPNDSKEFWIATSEVAAGQFGAARLRFERLRRESTDAVIRFDAAQRLARRGELPPLPLSPPNESAVARFERNIDQHGPTLLAGQTSRVTPAVLTLIAVNVLMFLAEVALGGSTNTLTLHSLGALEPFAVLGLHQYWRLVGALFLHYGPIHLLFNLYALFVLGPALEKWIGSARFAFAYLLSGIGSSGGVLLLWRFGVTHADLLVGASGSVMGIVGTWAGALLAHRHAPLARQRLINIVFIVALQTAFDFYTPQVSMAAHLSGLLSGFLIGLVLRPKHEL